MDTSLNGNLITTKNAAELSGYTSDYLARLTRSGKIIGRKVGHGWFVDKESLTRFLLAQGERKVEYTRELARVREAEYRARHAYPNQVREVSAETRYAPSLAAAKIPLRSPVFALLVTIFVLVSALSVAQAGVIQKAAERTGAFANEVSSGLRAALADAPANLALQASAIREEARPQLPHFATLSFAGAPHSPAPVFSIFGNTSTRPFITLVSIPIVSPITAAPTPDVLRSSASAAYAIITTPSLTLNAFTNALVALGTAIINATHFAIRADVALAYGIAEIAPESARAVALFIGNTGDLLARATARVPALATALYLNATSVPATLAPDIASAIFNVEYSVATRFVALANALEARYVNLISDTGKLAYDSTAALDRDTRALNASFGAALTSADHAPLLAAALPALSAGEQAALLTYRTIRGLFDSATGAFASLFGSSSDVAVVSNPPQAVLPFASSTVPINLPQPVPPPPPLPPPPPPPPPPTLLPPPHVATITNSYPTYTTVVKGVSEDFVHQSLATLRASILSTVAGMIQPVAAQTATNVTTIQQVNMIQDLSNLIVRNGDFRGGTFDSGSITNATGAFTSLTVNGVAVTGSGSGSGTVNSGTAGQFPYYAAGGTALTATSSLFASAAGNIGIGTTTPGSLLSLGNTGGINFSLATSTFNSTGGINLASGCFAVGGVCVGNGGGTVTSVALTTPTGLTVSGSPITTSGTLALALQSGYNIPLTASTTNWNTAYAEAVSSWTSPLQYSAGTASILQASGSQNGYLSSTDWSTFNNKQAALSFTYPLINTANTVSTAFGTTTANSFNQLQQFNANASTTQLTTTGSTYLATAGGKVGVGTTNPASDLSLGAIGSVKEFAIGLTSTLARLRERVRNDDFAITTNINTAGAQDNASLSSWMLRLGASDQASSDAFSLSRSPAGSSSFTEFLTLGSSGNLGIGTTSPYAPLSVVGQVVGSYFTATSTTATSTFAGGLAVGTGSSPSGLVYDRSTGNVGIGTAVPNHKLYVQDTAIRPAYITSSGGGDNTLLTLINTDQSWGDTAALHIAVACPNYAVTGCTGDLGSIFTYYSNVNPGMRIVENSGNPIYFNIGGGPFSNDATFAYTKMTLDQNGNFGIGTTSPTARLSVYATSTSATVPLFETLANNGSGTTTQFVITAAGNVGIGTTSPYAKLSVAGQVVGQNFVATSTTATSTFNGDVTIQNTSSTPGITSVLIKGGSGQESNCVGTTSCAMLTIQSSIANPNGNDRFFRYLTSSGTENVVMRADGGIYGNYIGVMDNTTAAMVNSVGNPGANVNGLDLGSIAGIGWSNSGAWYNAPDVVLSRLGANKLGIGTTGVGQSNGTLVAGTIGIGTTSPYAMLSVAGQVVGQNFVATSTTATSTFAGGALLATGGGNLGIGTTSPWRTLSVTGTMALTAPTISTTGDYLCWNTTTNEVEAGTSCTLSSQKFKTDIVPLSSASGLDEVMALNPVSFKFIPGYGDNGATTQLGFIAEQAAKVDPRLVTLDAQGNPNGFVYPNFTSILTKAIQDVNNGYTLRNVGSGATSSIASWYQGTKTPAITIDASGNVSVGTTAPLAKLTVSGNIFATSYEASPAIATVYTLGSTTVAAELPAAVLTAAGNVDLYKLATYDLSGVQALAAKINAQDVRLTALETRVAALESGAVSSASGLPAQAGSLFSTASLASALNSFGILVQKGIAQFNTLAFHQLVASPDASGASSAGSVTILAGNTVAQVNNSLVQPSTKIFVTFNSQVIGNWWVSDKAAGSFRVMLSAPQAGDVSFDYFLVQTEGAPAASESSGASCTLTASPTSVTPGDHVVLSYNFPDAGTFSIDQNIGSVSPALAGTTTSKAINADTTFTGTAVSATGATVTCVTSVSVTSMPSPAVAPPPPSVATSSTTAATSTSSTADTTPPVVTLVGAPAMQITIGDAFTDPGATATDNVDGNLTSKIKETGTVDTATAGIYTLTYSATDAAGNTGSVSRVVTVAAAPASSTASSTPKTTNTASSATSTASSTPK